MASYNGNRGYTNSNANLPHGAFPPPPTLSTPVKAPSYPGGSFQGHPKPPTTVQQHEGAPSHPRPSSTWQGPTNGNVIPADPPNALGPVTSSMNNMNIDASSGNDSAVANSPRNPPMPPPPGSSRITTGSATPSRPLTQLPATPGRIVPRPLGSFSGPPPSPSFEKNGRINNINHFPPPPAPVSPGFDRHRPLPPSQQNHQNSGIQTIHTRSLPPTPSKGSQNMTSSPSAPLPPPPSDHRATNTTGRKSEQEFQHHQHQQNSHPKPPHLPPKPPTKQPQQMPQTTDQYHQNNHKLAPSPPKPPVPPATPTGNRFTSPFPGPPSASTPIQQQQHQQRNLQHHSQPPPPPAGFHHQMPHPPPTPPQNQQFNQQPPLPSNVPHMQPSQQRQQPPPPIPPSPSQHFPQQDQQKQQQHQSYPHHYPNNPPPPPQFPQQQQYPPPPLQQTYPTHHQQLQRSNPPHDQQHQQYQQPYPPHLHQQLHQPLQEKDKIDPSQIPRIPLFTRPHHAPATIYPSKSSTGSNNISNVTSALTAMISDPPPPSDARYTLSSSHFINPSPRIMRSTVHTFPLDNATSRKCDLPLGVVVTPLAGLTSLCAGVGGIGVNGNGKGNGHGNDSGREQGDIYNDDDDDIAGQSELDYIPLDPENIVDPERIPVLRGPRHAATSQMQPKNPHPHTHSHPSSHPSPSSANQHPSPSSSSPRAIHPPRCTRCNAYLNPYCPPVSTSAFRTIGAYAPIQSYDCNMCGARGSISITEEYIANGTVDMATRCGTVEYEVGGAYCVRDRPVENVHLYGVEYAPFGCGGLGDGNGGKNGHHHHGTLESHGWKESLDAILEVGRCLRKTAPVKEVFGKDSAACVTTTSSPVKIGVFAFCLDMLVFPYVKRRKDQLNGDSHYDSDEEEIAVAIVSDIMEDPFCPLPLDMWTYDIGNRSNDRDWKRFCRIIDSFSGLMEGLLGDSLRSVSSSSEMPAKWMRNCGGAALVAVSDALKDSGGRATLITTRRPNYGVGALRDREAGQQSHYLRKECEQRLITPVQRVPNISAISGNDKDVAAGQFYRKLGEECAKYRVSLDIVVTNAVLSMPVSSMGSGQSQRPNMREYLDVATLSELCRVTCGKFKWLRVGNECGIAIRGDDSDGSSPNDSFTAEQLREELKRSALAYSGSDVVFKLRCSHGVQVKSYSPSLPLGNIVGDGIVDSAELEMSHIDSSSTIAVLLEHKVGGVVDTRESGKRGNEPPLVFFQSAVLYTTMTGRRRVRVSTLGLVTSKVPADVFRSADLGTVTTILTRQAISDIDHKDEGSLHIARDNVFQNCVSILANYRMHTTARTSPDSQLILPESLQLLPLFCLSLRKNRMFRHSLHKTMPSSKPFPTADERAYHVSYGRMVSPNLALQCVHPNLLQISDMRTRDGEWITPPTLETNNFVDEEVITASMRAVCQLPKSMNPSITCLDADGMYILDDRFAFYLFVGTNVAEEKWRDVFSVIPENNSANNTGVPVGKMALTNTESAHKLRNILQQLRMLNSPNTTLGLNARPTHAPLILVFVGRGSVFEEEMDSLLIDDPDSHEKSYVDFLCAIHRAVREKISKFSG